LKVVAVPPVTSQTAWAVPAKPEKSVQLPGKRNGARADHQFFSNIDVRETALANIMGREINLPKFASNTPLLRVGAGFHLRQQLGGCGE
jgi:hypothetical protein